MTPNVLRRKLAPRPAPPPPPPDESAVPRAMVQSMARAIGAATGLMVDAATGTGRDAGLAEVLDLADPDGLVALLDLTDGGVGVVVIDPPTLATLIEGMTTGQLRRNMPDPRPPTPTDAALMAEVIDALCAGLAEGPLAGARMARLVSDPRLLDSLLDDGGYRIVRLDGQLALGGLARAGRLMLICPAPPPPIPPDPGPTTATHRDADWSQALELAVVQAPAQLHAVLARVTRPLAEVLAMGRDSRIVLPLALLEEVRVESVAGERVALARLGQHRGMRALRLTWIPDDDGPGDG